MEGPSSLRCIVTRLEEDVHHHTTCPNDMKNPFLMDWHFSEHLWGSSGKGGWHAQNCNRALVLEWSGKGWWSHCCSSSRSGGWRRIGG
jgi:hypothetical protein